MEVVSNEDLEPPVINSISYSTTAVDVSDGPQDVTIDLDISDNPAGVDLRGFILETQSPEFPQNEYVTHQTEYVGSSEFELISGTEQRGIWRGTATFPQYSEAGE